MAQSLGESKMVWEQCLGNAEGKVSREAGLDLRRESHPCSVTVRMTRPLEQAVATIVCTFGEYAGRCGDKHKLCQAELKELLQNEMPTWTPVSSPGPILLPHPVRRYCLDSVKRDLGTSMSIGQQEGWRLDRMEVTARGLTQQEPQFPSL